MAGTLYIVATPIGNLEDITLRALRVLREVDLIAAEDTRRTSKLINHYQIQTRLTSLHEHNERTKTQRLVARLQAGDAVALVSDAGTPTISDPGAALVKAAVDAGIPVVSIPGPSAALTALAAAGFGPATAFLFVGFPPVKSRDRKNWFQLVAASRLAIVFFEGPHRIRKTLEQLTEIIGNRPILVARELTKAYEQLVRGPINEVLLALPEPRGEFTVVVSPGEPSIIPQRSDSAMPEPERLAIEFGQITENSTSTRRQAIAALSKRYGISARSVFDALERAKKLGP